MHINAWYGLLIEESRVWMAVNFTTFVEEVIKIRLAAGVGAS